MKIVQYDGEPCYTPLDILYQIKVTEIPKTINIEEIIIGEAEHGEQYYPDCWFVRGEYDKETKTFSFDNYLIYICCSEYFYEYKFTDQEIMEMTKLCIENTDMSKIK